MEGKKKVWVRGKKRIKVWRDEEGTDVDKEEGKKRTGVKNDVLSHLSGPLIELPNAKVLV